MRGGEVARENNGDTGQRAANQEARQSRKGLFVEPSVIRNQLIPFIVASVQRGHRAVEERLHERLQAHHQSVVATDGKGLGAVTAMHIKLEESDVASASYWETDAQGLFAAPPPLEDEEASGPEGSARVSRNEAALRKLNL